MEAVTVVATEAAMEVATEVVMAVPSKVRNEFHRNSEQFFELLILNIFFHCSCESH